MNKQNSWEEGHLAFPELKKLEIFGQNWWARVDNCKCQIAE